MVSKIEADLLVIGGGSGGLSVAAGAVQMGARVVLVEKGAMGGDCLNSGCVPSKSLLAAAKAAYGVKKAQDLGMAAPDTGVDFAKVHAYVHQVIAGIAPHDSVERFEELGVRVIKAPARFTGRREVMAGDYHIRAKRIVIATGSKAQIPPIPGLDSTPYLTNETIFDLTACPDHLVVIGGGPIGLEMAQAFRRLGSRVTVLERFQILMHDDQELVSVLRKALTEEGVVLQEGADVRSVTGQPGSVTVHVSRDGQADSIEGTHLLVATGRAPVVDGLDLEKAGIAFSKKGIDTDKRLRTSNKRVFAIGDVRGGLQFTHVAGYDAGIVIRNALFRLPAKADYATVPRVTYTEPELAHVGLGEQEARTIYGDGIRVLKLSYDQNDRARATGDTAGMIKLIAKDGRPLGVTVVGAEAGELIQPWILALSQKLKLSAMAGLIMPYPTLGELNKRVAGLHFTDKLFGKQVRAIVGLLQKLG